MKRGISLLKAILSATAFVLEFLPWGTAITYKWPNEDSTQWLSSTNCYSYVDPIVYFGCADFLKPITVILTAFILLFSIIEIFKVHRNFVLTVFWLSFAAAIASLPIIGGVFSYTQTGAVITLILVVIILLSLLQIKKRIHD